MPVSAAEIHKTLEEMQLTFQTDGKNFVYSGAGRYADLISTVVTVDEDQAGVTIMATLPEKIESAKRPAVYELMNLVHGQNIWHFRCFLDDDGRFMTLGKVALWGRPFNAVQFGDIFFIILVTTDRIFPCLKAIREDNRSGADAFESFFLKKTGNT